MVAVGAFGPAATTFAAGFDHDHAAWTVVLKQHVKDGRVDYAALKQSPAKLNAYVEELAKVSRSQFNRWSEPQQLAYLINLYNAATFQLIIKHYPVKSIKDIGGWFSGPWDQKMVRLFGKTTTLDHVEHKVIRKEYREPRIHFALVCAAQGCPPLLTEAYTGEKLDRQLDERGRAFLAQSHKNHIDASRQRVYLSPIFKWFDEDFEASAGSVLQFVKPYFGGRGAKITDDWSIRHTDYDWSLNAQ